jgi:hypothetical protein
MATAHNPQLLIYRSRLDKKLALELVKSLFQDHKFAFIPLPSPPPSSPRPTGHVIALQAVVGSAYLTSSRDKWENTTSMNQTW